MEKSRVKQRRIRARITLALIVVFTITLLCLIGFVSSFFEKEDNVSSFRTMTQSTPTPNMSFVESETFFFVNGNIPIQKNFITLPYRYPMHQRLSKNRTAAATAIHETQLHQQERCWANAPKSPLFPTPPKIIERMLQSQYMDSVDVRLQNLFQFSRTTSDKTRATFYAGYDVPEKNFTATKTPWWVSSEGENLPCTAEVQQRLHRYQSEDHCDNKHFLLTKTRQRSYGLGGALVLVAYDLLNAMILGRTLIVTASSPRWQFSTDECMQTGRVGLDCFYLPPTRCRTLPKDDVRKVHNVKQALRSKAKVIEKNDVEIPGLGRDNVPSDEKFFGPGYKEWTCYPAYEKWITNEGNMVVQGTFAGGVDARIFYMLSQALTYILRAPQPWFQVMLQHHLSPLGLLPPPNSLEPRCVIYVQDRAEKAKMREYYNAFGCHTVGLSLYKDYANAIISASKLDVVTPQHCKLFVSGGTPRRSYLWLKEQMERQSHTVLSTWNLQTAAAGSESPRWGASSPAASWVDMYAGVASTNWVCFAQSNWCRVIDLLRLTHGRAGCGFVEIGSLLLTSMDVRQKYCVVGDFPTKPFSNVLK